MTKLLVGDVLDVAGRLLWALCCLLLAFGWWPSGAALAQPQPLGLTPEKVDVTAPLSLESVFQLAVEQSAKIAQYEARLEAGRARYLEALSALYPSLNLLANQGFRNSNNSGAFNSSGSGSTGGSGTGSDRTDVSLSLNQILFAGMRHIAIAESAEALIKADQFDKQRASELLFLEVAQLYYTIIYGQTDLKLIAETDNALARRIEELRNWIKLGRSRESELLAAKADRVEIEVARTKTEGSLAAAREFMSFFIGIPGPQIRLDITSKLPMVPNVDVLLSEAERRSDVIASQQRQESAKQDIRAAKGERWPTITLDGRSYLYDDPSSQREWDVFFRFDLPIFDGYRIDSRVAEREAQERRVSLEQQELKKVAEREIRSNFVQYQALMAEWERLGRLAEVTRESYQAQVKDYQLGVVTNLDVLNALRQTFEAERRHAEAKSRLAATTYSLLIAAGRMPLN